MGECDLLKGCVFFNGKMNVEGDLGEQYKEYYCRGKYQECARYRVARILGREYVSHTLYPNMEKRAQQLIFAGK